MAKPTWEQLIENIPRTKLIDSSVWESLQQEWQTTADPSVKTDVDAFVQFLVDKEAITSWHQENLLAGKYKGFFLGAYKLLRHVGAGGMSSVYLAEHTMMGRQVAIKILPRSRVSSDTSYLQRFMQEAQAAAALNHPNIVTAYDIDNENGIYYFVMEYVDGKDLNGMVKANGPLDYAVAADYISQAACGLAHAHERGLIHRDMKPANLLVDAEGIVKILDMGLALFSEPNRASLTLAYDENVLGTADYLAPEQARNSHTVDARADIYSLGCTLYFLLTGHPPFREGTLPQRILAHQQKDAPAITIDRPDCPVDLIAICKKMMMKKPDQRQQNMLEVQENLTDWLLVHGYLPNNESMDNIVRSRNRLNIIQKYVEDPDSFSNPGDSVVNLDFGFGGSSSSSGGKSPLGHLDLKKKTDSSASHNKKKSSSLFGGLFSASKKPKNNAGRRIKSTEEESGNSGDSGTSNSKSSGNEFSISAIVSMADSAKSEQSTPAQEQLPDFSSFLNNSSSESKTSQSDTKISSGKSGQYQSVADTPPAPSPISVRNTKTVQKPAENTTTNSGGKLSLSSKFSQQLPQRQARPVSQKTEQNSSGQVNLAPRTSAKPVSHSSGQVTKISKSGSRPTYASSGEIQVDSGEQSKIHKRPSKRTKNEPNSTKATIIYASIGIVATIIVGILIYFLMKS